MKKTGAYLTVEAALVLPVVLGVIVLVIYLLFFQYDRCLMEHNTGILALRGCTIQVTNREELIGEIVEYSKQKDKRYLAWTMDDIAACLKGNIVRVERSGALKCPFPGLMFWSRDTEWGSEIVYENYRIEPDEFIRNCRKLIGGE